MRILPTRIIVPHFMTGTPVSNNARLRVKARVTTSRAQRAWALGLRARRGPDIAVKREKNIKGIERVTVDAWLVNRDRDRWLKPVTIIMWRHFLRLQPAILSRPCAREAQIAIVCFVLDPFGRRSERNMCCGVYGVVLYSENYQWVYILQK